MSEQIKESKYPNAAYLDALRKDNSQVIKEIQKMSNTRDYVSDFVPSSFKIKATNEASKRTQIEK